MPSTVHFKYTIWFKERSSSKKINQSVKVVSIIFPLFFALKLSHLEQYVDFGSVYLSDSSHSMKNGII